MKSVREMMTGKCRHFTGLRNAGRDPERVCDANVSYYDLMRVPEFGTVGCMCRVPCLGNEPGTNIRGNRVEFCGEFEPNTEQDIRDRLKEIEQMNMAMENKVSPCCYAELDESQVIQGGPHAGHGPRFCSKCNKVAFIV